jgi:hypothetical protein
MQDVLQDDWGGKLPMRDLYPEVPDAYSVEDSFIGYNYGTWRDLLVRGEFFSEGGHVG